MAMALISYLARRAFQDAFAAACVAGGMATLMIWTASVLWSRP
jgi:hypothetical protein